MSTENFKVYANQLRSKIKDVARLVHCFKNHPAITHTHSDFSGPGSNRGEMAANIVLSYRHLEDAAMRLGKAIQAFEGGESCYDKVSVGAPDAVSHVSVGEIPKPVRDTQLSWPGGTVIPEFADDRGVTEHKARVLGYQIAYRDCYHGEPRRFYLMHDTDKLKNREFVGFQAVCALKAYVDSAWKEANPPFVPAPRAFVEKPFTDESHSA